MSAGSPTAVAAPPSAPTTTTPADTTTLRRAPPAWLTAEKLTTERAHQLLDDLLAPCPSPDADAETHRADAQRKKFALLVFAMGAGKRPENTASPPQGATAPVLNPPKDKGVADETKDVRADDAFAGLGPLLRFSLKGKKYMPSFLRTSFEPVAPPSSPTPPPRRFAVST